MCHAYYMKDELNLIELAQKYSDGNSARVGGSPALAEP
jgi:hypothetical protein